LLARPSKVTSAELPALLLLASATSRCWKPGELMVAVGAVRPPIQSRAASAVLEPAGMRVR
jgi:hypothetical protein